MSAYGRVTPVSDGTRIWISLPDELLARLDRLAQGSVLSRSDAVVKAVEAYVVRAGGDGLWAALAQGYKEMAALNLAIALDDEDTLADTGEHERKHPEADSRGGA